MILLKTTDILRFRLGGAITTNELDFVAGWVDITGFSPSNNSGTSSGATNVTLIGAPSAGIRQVKFISIINKDTVDATVTVEFYVNPNARQLISWVLSVGDTLTYIDSDGWKVYDSTGKLKVTSTGGGGGGSVTSANFASLQGVVSVISQQVSVLSARVASNSAQMTSADNAISAVAADALSKANAVSNAVSVLSVIVSNTVSAVQANSADVTSLKDRVSAISATTSNLNSAIVANSAQMTSADNAISNAVSIVSVAAADALSKANAVSNAVSVLSTIVSNTVSAVQANSADVTSLKNRVSANSAQMVSADNAISNAVSIVSAAVVSVSAVLESHINTVSNAVSIVSVAAAGKNTIITLIDEGTSVLSNPAFIEFTGAGVSVSVSGTKAVIIIPGGAGGGSVTSANFVSLRDLVQANSAQMTSADNAISNAVSIVSVAAADALSKANAVSNAVSVLSVVVSNTVSAVQANSADVTSLKNRVSANSAQMVSADNAISNAVSVVSVAVTLKNNIITIIDDGTSIVSNPTAIDFTGTGVSVSVSGTKAIVIIGGGGSGSVTSADFVSLRGLVQSNSAQMTSADNAISNAVSIVSVAAADALSKANAVSNAVSALSTVVSNINSAVQTNSADVTSLKNRVSAISADLTSFKQSINNFTDVSAVPSADSQVLTWNSAAAQWVASTITAGVGSVTSAELSAVSAAAASNIAVLSQTMTSADDVVSANAASANNVLSQQISVLSVKVGGILNTQIRIVSDLQSTNGSALVDVSGMVLTVGANETWEFHGVLLVSTSATTAGLRAGFSVPPLSTPRYAKFIGGSAAQSATIAGGAGQLAVSGQSITLSITGVGPAGAAIPIVFNGLFNTTSSGTVRLMACGIASTAASPLHIMAGTYMICKRLV